MHKLTERLKKSGCLRGIGAMTGEKIADDIIREYLEEKAEALGQEYNLPSGICERIHKVLDLQEPTLRDKFRDAMGNNFNIGKTTFTELEQIARDHYDRE